MKILNDYEKGYLEAMIDGEGMLTVMVSRSKAYKCGFQFSPACSISNTDMKLLDKIKEVSGDGGSIQLHQRYRPEKNYKESYIYRMGRHQMRWLLPQLKLTAKEDQRKLVLEALEITKGHKGLGNGLTKAQEMVNVVNKIRTLNQRGGKSPKTYKYINMEGLIGMKDLKSGVALES